MSAAALASARVFAPGLSRFRATASRSHTRAVRSLCTTPKAHDVGKDSAVSEMNVDPEIERFREHQASAAKLSFADECRTLVDLGRYAVISTFGREHDGKYPSGSIVGFASDAMGRPIFAMSTMSGHTGDLAKNGNCALTVTAPGFAGAADARVTLTGTVTKIEDTDETAEARAAYLAKHPDAFWVDFGDFAWHRMDAIVGARLVGGFARAGGVDGDEYLKGTCDPVAKFAAPIASHMNADHADSIIAMTKHYVGLTVDSASISGLDSLGMTVTVSRGGERFKIRLPFETPARDRKQVKEVMVAMTKNAVKAMSVEMAEGEGEK